MVFGKLQVKRFKGLQESAAVRAFDQATLHYGIPKVKGSPQFLSFGWFHSTFLTFAEKPKIFPILKRREYFLFLFFN